MHPQSGTSHQAVDQALDDAGISTCGGVGGAAQPAGGGVRGGSGGDQGLRRALESGGGHAHAGWWPPSGASRRTRGTICSGGWANFYDAHGGDQIEAALACVEGIGWTQTPRACYPRTDIEIPRTARPGTAIPDRT